MVEIERLAHLPKGVLGVLRAPNFECFTVERPWLDNQPFISCIPEGTWEVRPFTGRRFKSVSIIEGVPNREFILIHSANRPTELSGCIAPGVRFDFEDQCPVVWNSRFALQSLFEAVGREFQLKIFSSNSKMESI